MTTIAVPAYLLTHRLEDIVFTKSYKHQGETYVGKKSLRLKIGGPEKDLELVGVDTIYLELVYLVTALVPSETACLASSPGRRSLTAVWISREVMVERLL